MNLIRRLASIGLWGSCRLFANVLITKLTLPQARLLRYPFYIRREGSLVIGKGFSANAGLVLDTYGATSVLRIGENVMANYRLHVGACSSVTIGDGTLFGSDCLVIDHSHGSYESTGGSSPLELPQQRKLVSAPISIGKNCWFGDRVSVLPGVSVGDGVVVGVGSVVSRDLPDYVVAVGAPARVIKRYCFDSKSWVRVSAADES